MTVSVQRSPALVGRLRPPSDKSLTHRAFMLGAAAESPSFIQHPLLGEDCVSTLRCLESMGLRYDIRDGTVHLEPAAEWSNPDALLDCGNSGTTMRLLAGMVASRPLNVTMTGDASLSRRPMRRIAEPLRLMGAQIQGDTAPLHIRGGNLQGIRYVSPVASAQIKSAVLLAGLRAQGQTWVREPAPSRDHTERMLRSLGVKVQEGAGGVGVEGSATWKGFEFSVPADISSAAFWMVAGSLVPNSQLTLEGVGVNPTRTGILTVLDQTGANVRIANERDELGEPVADLMVGACHSMKPFTISGALVPRLIDEIPVLSVLATQLDGTSIIRDAEELRVKESDRIETMATALRLMGAHVETTTDGMAITGPTPLKAIAFDAEGDHRIAMSLAVAGLIAEGEMEISGAHSIQTSYPSFMEDLRSLIVA